MLPGQFDTDRLRSNHEKFAARMNVTVEEAARTRAQQRPGAALRHAAEFGAACAFLCSAHAGFITGQNMLLDGGQYRGLM